MRGQLRERQVCHAPGDGSFLKVVRDEQIRFVRVAGFLPYALAVWITLGERVVHGIERRDRMMRWLAREACREATPAGFRLVENRGFGECLRT